jgi:hypothetical protein
LASLVFAIPMIVSIVLYIRNRGFVPDDDLTNATLPIEAPPPPVVHATDIPLPAPIGITARGVVLSLLLAATAIGLGVALPKGLEGVVDYRTTRQQAIEAADRWLAGVDRQPFEKHLAMPAEGFRSWDRNAPGEEGGAPPSDFDSVAAQYLAQHGMPERDIAEVMKRRVQAATWMVRTFTPMQKREYRIELDPRTAGIIGYHRYQDEKMPGARLEEAQALGIARAAFGRFGIDPNSFDVKESLNFQQPARRDWLFHFQEKKPLVADAWRRISVRVAGSEVSQFTTTIKIPDAEYRKESERTLLNVGFLLANLLGMLSILALVIAGLIIATRKGHFPWQKALRWTFALAFIPVANAVLHFWQSQVRYDTTVQWQTFIFGDLTGTGARLGLDLGLLFLAFIGILVLYPYALRLGSREARARFGVNAAIGALSAVALLALRQELMQFVTALWPHLTTLRIDVPQSVAIPLPAFFAIGDAVIRAVELSAAVALFWAALSPFRIRYPWLPPLVTMAAVFCSQLDRSANVQQLPLMMLDALTVAIVLWVAVRYFLRDNLLAYPLTVALLVLLHDAAEMLPNHRFDLNANAIATLGAAIALLLWDVIPGAIARSRGPSSTIPADSHNHPR